jgi:integrase/recombinase XerD
LPKKIITPEVEEVPVVEYLEPAQTAKLEEAALYLRDALLIRLLRRLGCRISEVLGIDVSQIDFKKRTIQFLHEKKRITRLCPVCGTRLAKSFKLCPECATKVEKTIEDSKNEVEYRSLPIDRDTLDMIKQFIDSGGTHDVQVTNSRGDLETKKMLFNITRQRAWSIVKECAERAGLPKIINVRHQRIHNVGPHKLRDAFATNALNIDDSMSSVKNLQDHLGHVLLDTTMRYKRTTGKQHKAWLDNVLEKTVKEEAAGSEEE